MTDLARLVAACRWSDLLPRHREGEPPPGAPTLLDEWELDPSTRVLILGDDDGGVHAAPVVLADGSVRRALPGDGAAEALLARLTRGSGVEGAFTLTSWHSTSATGEHSIDVDQTNESIMVGSDAVVKWTVDLPPGPHPAASLLDELVRSGFTGTPRPWGMLQWHPNPGEPPRLVASVVDLLPGAVDGWEWAVGDVREAASTGDSAGVRRMGRALGVLLATFHRSLRGTARVADAEDQRVWATGARADLVTAIGHTLRAGSDTLRQHESDLWRILDSHGLAAGSSVQRVHGDLHVGQFLRTPDGAYAITDFDGNPVAPVGEATRLQPTALDVAGLVQSIRHVGIVVRRHHPDLDAAAVNTMVAVAESALLRAYVDALGEDRASFDPDLLRPYQLRQVCREFTYAATHLPRWAYVPEAALPVLMHEEGAEENV